MVLFDVQYLPLVQPVLLPSFKVIRSFCPLSSRSLNHIALLHLASLYAQPPFFSRPYVSRELVRLLLAGLARSIYFNPPLPGGSMLT